MLYPLTQKISVMLAAASQSAGATRSANLDCLGADYATIIIPLGIEVNTNGIGPDIVLKESDDTTATNFATWSSSGTRSDEALVAAHQVVFHVDTRTRKRYLNLSITSETTTNDHVTAAAIALLSRKESNPVGTAGLIGSTSDVVVIL